MAMDSMIGFVGDGYVMLAADATTARSVLVFNTEQDKIMDLDGQKLLAFAGESGDNVQFSEFIQKNIHLYKFRTGISVNTAAAAHYIRGELARFLRESPYTVNLLLGGYDSKEGPSLYFMDYLASMTRLNTAAQGYGSFFVASVLDRDYRKNLSLEEGLALMDRCIKEIQLRLVLNAPRFVIKLVDKDGVRILLDGQGKELDGLPSSALKSKDSMAL
mmetsp:Transcript_43966/g.71528  ORF Transcript_43966/g.71528 Transcript_43966/m.71528 type:complete len:217 (-) Transcript_43966:141-791(-)|eukprot:CAMPEP_0184656344 /NCGR_PEP_ID=MMETSP0308-20130426/16397_1 /TAXON_ID=38269 /ORGANISM="Gloeochaete witrockiana, Strain SAG 46.84" /LENGTH=216 /DNA_ID=CAMNT_0027093419 /DNA_START=72 /DNA_END=722 /DNA_ORIENTATION=+